MLRKSVFILALLCFLAISNFAIAAQLNWVGPDPNWFNPASWGGAVPTNGDWACVQPSDANGQPIIDGVAVTGQLDISPWSGGGTGLVDMNSGSLDFGSMLRIAGMSDFDSSSYIGPGYLYVHGGTVTTNASGSQGLIIGTQFGRAAGKVIMYGGLISVPRITLYQGSITLYGGTLELRNSAGDTGPDANFAFSQLFTGNKIDISGGTLKLAGDHNTTDPCLPSLISAGRIYSSRGTLGTPTFDGTWTTLTSSDNNMAVTWGPTPANNATEIHYVHGTLADPCYITLIWNDGNEPNIINHAVYFGTNANIVNSVYGDANFMGEVNEVNSEPNSFDINSTRPYTFVKGTTYYWRVDANVLIDDVNTARVKGRVWNFKTHDGAAYNPKPRNGQVGLNEPLALSWTAGDFTGATNGHKIYFNTAYFSGSMRPGGIGYRGQQTGTTYPLSSLYPNFTLVPAKTYYWAVDEYNGTTLIARSPTWSFTPTISITIEDFEDYNSTADVNANWGMNYAIASCYSPDFGYQAITATSGNLNFVLDGAGKHGRFSYNALPFSEVKRNYPGGTVFSNNNVLSVQPTSLKVEHIGVATNGVDEIYNRMYVALEDTAGNVGVYENEDSNAAQAAQWTPWYSKLDTIKNAGYPSAVNLGAVSNFYLGFGLRCLPVNDQGFGGDGNVMFDNITLNASICNPLVTLSADLDGDCDVDINDLLTFSNDWLKKGTVISFPTVTAPRTPVLWYKFDETTGATCADSSGNSYNGTINSPSSLTWKSSGRDANHPNCIYLPSGANSYISVSDPNAALGFMGDSNHATDGGGITFSLWINADLTAPVFGSWLYGFIVVSSTDGNGTNIACPHHWANDWSVDNAWAGWGKSGNAGFSLGPSARKLDYGGRWNHWSFVKAPDALRWYCNGVLIRQELATDTNDGDANIPGKLFTLPVSTFTIANSGWAGYWVGYIQDFQVYDHALSSEEVAYLATDGTGSRILPLSSRANFVSSGEPATEIVDFQDMSFMGDQWHQIKLWP